METGKRLSELSISRNTLKLLALFSMICDHIAYCFLGSSTAYHTVYLVMRIFGRIAFPVFCFLLVQGFLTTKNVKKYLLRIFLFACVSEIPYDLFRFRTLFSLEGQNVMFTLGISLVALILLSHFEGHPLILFLIVAGSSLIAVLLKTDYTFLGIFFTSILYLWRNEKINSFLLLCVLMGMQGELNLWEILSLPFLFFADTADAAEEGKHSSLIQKYFFYFFYPAHLLLLHGISLLL